mmetsp:Transcript_59501/g.153199  ORF Transcript_59501/g.153199 Transcript_59501/m.153199 type:complete len:537 (-) Transcript_59501:323-1933(-)|eukprot:CAMPEP_0195067454 /NCGR_PEP_ID=MMETSP0448-20130528/12504_1 /TAXON_ID=66468 /ORGANISM="Heterocapsa triquestra, Strain CCMP 448" /LENGTH=536 /DNA_ID=CAMNT_0040098871 /DNA_START=154 /DNA_END=1764 /DNA_ORIENTATION=+
MGDTGLEEKDPYEDSTGITTGPEESPSLARELSSLLQEEADGPAVVNASQTTLLLKGAVGEAERAGREACPHLWRAALAAGLVAVCALAALACVMAWRALHECCTAEEPKCLGCQAEVIATACRLELNESHSFRFPEDLSSSSESRRLRSPRDLSVPISGSHTHTLTSRSRGPHISANCSRPCGFSEGGVDYPGFDIGASQDVASPGSCCSMCRAERNCTAWSWEVTDADAHGNPVHSVCRLKRPTNLTRVSSKSFVSGLPFAGVPIVEGLGFPMIKARLQHEEPLTEESMARLSFTLTTTTTTTMTTTTITLHCWALLQPKGSEPALIHAQEAAKMGIFACDSTAVYSNESMRIGTHQTRVVPIDLTCPIGGQWNTALNTQIFKRVYQEVMRDGDFRRHDWTIKADLDTVFIPWKLRNVLSRWQPGAQEGNGTVLMNCRWGLHGPMEVMSRRALEVMSPGCWLSNAPGSEIGQEDFYIHMCAERLGIRLQPEANCLAEVACQTPRWFACDTPHAAFHPFKSVPAWQQCYATAVGR